MDTNSNQSSSTASFIRNLRFSLRLCMRFPGTTAMAVVVLAMGVALSSMMYTIATGVISGTGGADLDERYLLVEWETGQSWSKRMNTHDFKVFRSEMESMEEIIGIQDASFWVSIPALDKEGKPYEGLVASPGLIDMVDASPVIGNLFSDTAVESDMEPEVLISDSVWLHFFDRSEEAIGAHLMLGDMRCRVVGVMPLDFGFPGNKHLWVATDWNSYDGALRTATPIVSLVGKRKAEYSIDQVRAEMEAIAGSLATQFPDTNREQTQLRVEVYRDKFVDGESTVLITLMLIGALPVLILACVNVFNIIIGRTANRTHELAVRTSLGAKRRNIIWQVLLDGLTLAGLGAALGIGLASVGLYYLTEVLKGFDVPAMLSFSLGWPVIVFAVVISIIAGLASSFIPAWRASSIDAYSIMKDEANSSTSIYIGWLSKVAVISQVAFSGILLFMSIVFLMPSIFFNSIELPYDEDEVLTAAAQFWTDSQISGYDDMNRFYTEVKQRMIREPGVDAVTMTSAAFGLIGGVLTFEFEGEDKDALLSSDFSQVIAATPDYLEVYGVEPISGRMLNAFDTADSLPVCVVNTHFVSTHCKHLDPIGMRVRLNSGTGDEKWLTIVGVIPSLKPKDIGGSQDELDRSFSEIIRPFSQNPSWNPTLVVRAQNAKSPELRQALRQAVQDAAPLVRMPGSIMTVGERLDTVSRIFDSISLGAKAFGAAVLCMSLIGLYSIVNFATKQRSKEFGIRLAIGSSSWGIAKSVLKPWAIMIGAGIVFSALALFVLLSIYLYYGTMDNSSSTDWQGFAIPAGITAAILVIASFVAMALPAWKATKIDPMSVIRAE